MLPKNVNHGQIGLLVCLAAALVVPTGCGPWHQSDPPPRFLPDWDEAQRSLEAALFAWRDAPSPPPESLDSPSVKFVDKQRRPEDRLTAFQILGRSDVENARQFTVRLTFDRGTSPQLVRYNVLGRNPVWVFRLEDYEMISHWEHDMSQPAPSSVLKPKNKEKRADLHLSGQGVQF
jgi:hypothetical protein